MILGNAAFSVQPTHAQPAADSLFLCFQNDTVLLSSAGGAFHLPVWAQALSLLPKVFRPFELAHAGQTAVFSPHPFQKGFIPEGNGLCYQNIGVFRQMENNEASILASGWHLWSWYDKSRFCGHCGKPLKPDDVERAVRCEACGQLSFPTIAPAIIVAITRGDRILLAQNAHSAAARYALIAGYVEVGETLEHAVHREVLEEVGLRLLSLRYIGNQPWGISGSQMFAFHAEAAQDGPITLQRSELSDARWFSRGELEPRDHTVSIAFELIERFRTGRL